MTISASRLLEDHKVVFAGIGLPLVAAALARRRQAPHLSVVLEGGIVGTHLSPGQLPSSTNEMRAAVGAEMLTSVTDIFLFAQRGFFDYGFLGVAQIDPYGNINTSIIGSPDQPTVRLPGPGGANDIISMCNETLVVTQHEPRRFVEQVDFVSAPGASPPNVFREGGPVALVTPRCLFAFDRSRGRFRLESVHPGHTVEEVRDETGFDFDCADGVPVTGPPSPETLWLMRERVAPELAEIYPQFVRSVFGFPALPV